MIGFVINKEKAKNALLFVATSLENDADFHKTYKILYFADQKHLALYGRPIIGDMYVKMKFGPVPSFVKDMVEGNIEDLTNVVEVYNRMYIRPLMSVDFDYLSESDLECIKESIEENKILSFTQLTKKSHDSAWDNAAWQLDYLEVFKAVSESKEMFEYVKLNMVNNNISLK